MFVSIMFHLKKSANFDPLVKVFRESGIQARELEIRPSGRDVYFVFKTDDINPVIDFTKNAPIFAPLTKEEIDLEFDDGTLRSYNVCDGILIAPDDNGHLDHSSWISLEHLTGIKDDLGKAVKVWARELKATPERMQAKLQAVTDSKRRWDIEIDKEHQRLENAVAKKAGKLLQDEGPVAEVPKRPAIPLSIDGISHTISIINGSGKAIIPFIVFPSDLEEGISREAVIKFARYFDKSSERVQLFKAMKSAFIEYTKLQDRV